MRKFFKRFPFKKVFVYLFILFYTFFPSLHAVGVSLENDILENTEIDESEDILNEGISDPEWIAKPLYTYEDGVYTVDLVQERQYTYPDNEDVRVMFTSVTEEGNLTINKVALSEKEKIELNTTDDYAWEITSSMSNGSFEYNLTLPNTLGNTDVEVMYTEDGEVYESIDNVVVNEGVIYIEGLDHFTVFVVAQKTPSSEIRDAGKKCIVWIERIGQTECFSTITKALEKAENGDTIFTTPREYKENIVIDKSITLITKAEKKATIKPADSSLPTIKVIKEGQVIIENFTLTEAGTLGAIHIQNTNGVTVKNNIFLNNEREVWIDGSQKVIVENNDFKQDPPYSVPTFGLSIANSKGSTKENSYHEIKNNKFSNLLLPTTAISLAKTNNNLIEGNFIEENLTYFGGIKLSDSFGNRIEKNTISNNNQVPFGKGEVSGSGIILSASCNNEIVENRIAAHNTGIHLSTKSTNNTIAKNLIHKNWHGIYFQDESSTEGSVVENHIKNNEIQPNNTKSIGGDDGSSGISFHIGINNISTKIKYNNFEGNKGLAIRYSGENELNASENWWGHISGPSGEGSGSGDSVSSNVLFQEWLCEPYESEKTPSVSKNGVCKLKPPVQVGYKTQGNNVLLKCNKEYTNINGISVRWSDDNYFGQDNFKYLRQYKVGDGTWGGNELCTDLYTNYLTFGGVPGVDNIYGSRVKVFYDTNNNNLYDEGEPVSDWSNACSITYDNTPPTVEITSPTQGDLLKDIIEIKGHVFDNNLSHYNIAIYPKGVDVEDFSKRIEQNTEYTSKFDEKTLYTWGTTNGNFPDGEYQIRLAARDLAGNRDLNGNSKHVITVYVDNTPPSSTITSPSNGFITNQKMNIEGKTEDNHSVQQVTLSYTQYNAETEQCEGNWEELAILENKEVEQPFNWSSDTWLPENGIYCIKAQGTDLAGNIENTSIIKNIIYDTVDPEISLVNLINGVLEQVTADGGLSGLESIEIKVGDGEWEDYKKGMNLNDMANRTPGTYIVHIKVRDKAGNKKETQRTFTIPAPFSDTLGEVLGALTEPFTPQPVQAQSRTSATTQLLAQSTQEEELPETEEEAESSETEQKEETKDIQEKEVKSEDGEEEEKEGLKWWVYILILFPLLFFFFILYKRRKEEEEKQL